LIEDTLKMPRSVRALASRSAASAFPLAAHISESGGKPYLPPPAGRFALVLVDSPTIQQIVGMILRREGYEIQSFCNGIEAMKWFACPGSRIPDLMLVDLGLPKINGYDIVQKFKAKPRFAQTVCIMLSSRDGRVDKRKGKMAGVAAYITKPFTSEELMTTVHTSFAQN
jgi:twitching motility two-component system response regulator PilG